MQRRDSSSMSTLFIAALHSSIEVFLLLLILDQKFQSKHNFGKKSMMLFIVLYSFRIRTASLCLSLSFWVSDGVNSCSPSNRAHRSRDIRSRTNRRSTQSRRRLADALTFTRAPSRCSETHVNVMHLVPHRPLSASTTSESNSSTVVGDELVHQALNHVLARLAVVARTRRLANRRPVDHQRPLVAELALDARHVPPRARSSRS
jgi:hypothetical protein